MTLCTAVVPAAVTLVSRTAWVVTPSRSAAGPVSCTRGTEDPAICMTFAGAGGSGAAPPQPARTAVRATARPMAAAVFVGIAAYFLAGRQPDAEAIAGPESCSGVLRRR